MLGIIGCSLSERKREYGPALSDTTDLPLSVFADSLSSAGEDYAAACRYTSLVWTEDVD